jgi:hypothetical protein
MSISDINKVASIIQEFIDTHAPDLESVWRNYSLRINSVIKGKPKNAVTEYSLYCKHNSQVLKEEGSYDSISQVREMWKNAKDDRDYLVSAEHDGYHEIISKDVIRRDKEMETYIPDRIDPNAPVKPSTGYRLFSKIVRPVVKEGNKNATASEITKIIAGDWAHIKENDKNEYDVYMEEAAADVERYNLELETYVRPAEHLLPEPKKSKPRKNRTIKSDKPSGAKSAWVFYRAENKDQLLENGVEPSDITSTLSIEWKILQKDKERAKEYAIYTQMASKDKERHAQEMEVWNEANPDKAKEPKHSKEPFNPDHVKPPPPPPVRTPPSHTRTPTPPSHTRTPTPPSHTRTPTPPIPQPRKIPAGYKAFFNESKSYYEDEGYVGSKLMTHMQSVWDDMEEEEHIEWAQTE